MYNDFICFPQIQTVMVEFAFKWLYIIGFLSFPSPTPVHQSLRAPKRLVFLWLQLMVTAILFSLTYHLLHFEKNWSRE